MNSVASVIFWRWSRQGLPLSILLLVLIAFIMVTFAGPTNCFAQVTLPQVSLGFKNVDNPTDLVAVIRIILLLTVLSLAPAILIMMTSFTRILIVFGFLRQAMGVQQLPPNQLLVGMSLFLTFFLMSPVFQEVNEQALKPMLAGTIGLEPAIEQAALPLRRFMFSQTRPEDLNFFVQMAARGIEPSKAPKTLADVSTFVLIPAFILSELKTAFQIGFLLFLPFLVIDIVVSSVLMAMGMMMLPPVMISLPIKIMLFVLVDGWGLVFGSLIKSFGE